MGSPLRRFVFITWSQFYEYFHRRSSRRRVYITPFHKKLAALFTLLIFSYRTRVTLTGRQRKETLHSTTVSFRTSQKPWDCCWGPGPAQTFPTTTGRLRWASPGSEATICVRSWWVQVGLVTLSNDQYFSCCTPSPVRRQCLRTSTSTGTSRTTTAPLTSQTRRLWRTLRGPWPGHQTRRGRGRCLSSPRACPGRRSSRPPTTGHTGAPRTGHGPTPRTVETHQGATGTPSCLLPLLLSLKSHLCVSSRHVQFITRILSRWFITWWGFPFCLVAFNKWGSSVTNVLFWALLSLWQDISTFPL